MDIGIDVKAPQKECGDENCPFHGDLKVRGQIIEGRVVSDKMQGTVIVEKDYYRYMKKFERYEKRRSKLMVHNPECMDVSVGDAVKIMECRPISKKKTFVVIEKLETKNARVKGKHS